jgi:GH35 family endo-1,4-beta-xylanase
LLLSNGIDSITKELANEYDIEEKKAEYDVKLFISQLKKRGIYRSLGFCREESHINCKATSAALHILS